MGLSENEIQVFIDGAKHYFDTISDIQVNLGSPYLITPTELPGMDYTGIIGISGVRKGCVYVTAPRILLRHLLLNMGESEMDAELMRDMVGEVANTISGNARKAFGAQFMISVPLVIQGQPESMQLPKNSKAFVIPINWKNYNASLVVCLQ